MELAEIGAVRWEGLALPRVRRRKTHRVGRPLGTARRNAPGFVAPKRAKDFSLGLKKKRPSAASASEETPPGHRPRQGVVSTQIPKFGLVVILDASAFSAPKRARLSRNYFIPLF